MILPVDEVLPGVRLMAGAVQAQSGTLAPKELASRVHSSIDLHELVTSEESVVVCPVLVHVLQQRVCQYLFHGIYNHTMTTAVTFLCPLLL